MERQYPKRRKDKDNSYNIFKMNQKYYIEFIDSQKEKCLLEVSKELYEAFDRFELDDKKYLNIYERHIEQSEVYDISIHKRSNYKEESAEQVAIKNLMIQELYAAISNLPEIQRRRLTLYYFDDLTYEQIAKIENCSYQAIMKSVAAAEKKIKNFLIKGCKNG